MGRGSRHTYHPPHRQRRVRPIPAPADRDRSHGRRPALLHRPHRQSLFLEHDMAAAPPRLKRKPSDYIRENMVVTTSGMNYSAPLLLTIQTLGIDNVLFAADYPFETVRE